MKSASKRDLLAKIKELLSTREYLLTGEIARKLDISKHAVYYLIRRGDLIVIKTGTGKRRSIKVVDVYIDTDSNVEKARKRISILWDYYNKHGKLLLKDIHNLCGQPYGNVYKSFNTNNMEGPPVWDSKPEIAKRKAKTLIALADKLDQVFLTEDQATECLSIRKDRLYSVLDGISKYHTIPGIGEEIPHYGSLSYDSIVKIAENYYPSGLQVLDTRPGPDGTTIYRIR